MVTAAVFTVGVVAGIGVGIGLVFLFGCGKRADVAVEAAREAKRKGLHPELN